MHPADKPVFDRIKDKHQFNLNCLPTCFMGPLRSAPIVLLYLSSSFAEVDLAEATSEQGQDRYMRIRRGDQPLPGPDEHMGAWNWWTSRTRCFDDDWRHLQTKIAVLNIGAYHSKKFRDDPLLAALPSSRAALEWAQTELFPL
jgi:hypothetical protein